MSTLRSFPAPALELVSKRPSRQAALLAATAGEDRDASGIVTLLADALEEIARMTSDSTARELAEDALALFEGR